MTLPITPIDDALDEDTEAYRLVLSDLENVTLSQESMTISLVDTDPEPSLGVTDLLLKSANGGILSWS